MRLVFEREDLPPGRYHDIMPVLSSAYRWKAAAILIGEAKKYPPQFLGRVGLKAIGVFDACAGEQSDARHVLDPELGGYRYYGIWNRSNACAIAYYTGRQLCLTFHHEIFHHIDAMCNKATGSYDNPEVDRRYQVAIAGESRYSSPVIQPADLAALKHAGQGEVLEEAVSKYAAKNLREDHAETARYFMSHMADALSQIVERPELPGSQRILYCLGRYHEVLKDGPDIDWFVDVALQRARKSNEPRDAR
jgi:hypothetical protein